MASIPDALAGKVHPAPSQPGLKCETVVLETGTNTVWVDTTQCQTVNLCPTQTTLSLRTVYTSDCLHGGVQYRGDKR